MKDKWLQEAIQIGNKLLVSADRDKYGLFWKTADLDIRTNTIQWIISESLYNGTSGIAVFLLELYRQTSDKKYLHAAKEAMQWVNWYCQKYPTMVLQEHF